MIRRTAACAAAVALAATTVVSVAVAAPATASPMPQAPATAGESGWASSDDLRAESCGWTSKRRFWWTTIHPLAYGDVNADFEVTSADADEAAELVRDGEFEKCADVDRSGEVTSDDVQYIKDAVAGLVSLPVS